MVFDRQRMRGYHDYFLILRLLYKNTIVELHLSCAHLESITRQSLLQEIDFRKISSELELLKKCVLGKRVGNRMHLATFGISL